MFALVLGILAVLGSLYFWGMIRTAIWLAPALFVKGLLPLESASLLSFWTITLWLSPYEGKAFEVRKINGMYE